MGGARSTLVATAIAATALFAGYGAATCLAAQSTPAPSYAEPVRLTIETAMGARESLTEIVLRIPLEGRRRSLVRSLRATPAGYSKRYRKALEKALRAGGLLDPAQASLLVDVGEDLPRLRIADGWAILATRATGPTLWEEAGGGDRLTLPPIDVPPRGHLTVRLEIAGAEPLSVRPLPHEDDGQGKLRWELPGGSSTRIAVRLSEPLSGEPPFTSTQVVAVLVGGLPFFVLLGLAGSSSRRGRAGRALFAMALAGAAVSVLGAAFYVDQELTRGDAGNLDRYLGALLPALGVAAFAATPLGSRRLAAMVAVALSCLYAVLISAGARAAGLGFLADTGLPTAQVGSLCAVATLLFLLVLVTAIRWSWETAPATVKARLSRRVRPPTVAVVLVATAIAIAVQFLLATRAHEHPFGFVSSDRGEWSVALELFLDFFPFQLTMLTQSLALTLLGIGLSIWLWERVGEGDLPFTGWGESVAVALLLATVVIGTGGEIDGYSAPFAFVFALIGVAVAVRVLGGSPRGGVATDARTRRQAGDLLSRAVQFAAMKRRRHAVADRLIAGEIDEATYDEQLEGLDRKQRELFEVESLSSVEAESRPREALAVGIGGGSGARRRLSTVWRRGAWILIVPAVYSAYAVVDLQVPTSLTEAFGPAFVLVELLNQVVLWPIAGWAFVLLIPVLPGRFGPLKGLGAGLFCAVPPGLASLLVDDPPGPEQWLFVSAELTLVFVALGAVLDFRSVRAAGGDLRQLGELYSITSLRAGLVYLGTLAVLLLSVIQGLASGSGASALEELFTNAGSLLPPGPGH